MALACLALLGTYRTHRNSTHRTYPAALLCLLCSACSAALLRLCLADKGPTWYMGPTWVPHGSYMDGPRRRILVERLHPPQ
jgi:hypothetical protein